MLFQVKLIKMPLVNLGLIESQNRSKSSQNNMFHVFTLNPSYLVIFVNFDSKLTLEGIKNPNFDLIVGMG